MGFSLADLNIGAAFTPLVQAVADLIPDPQKKAALVQEMQEKQMDLDAAVQAAQAKIDDTEAASTNVFVAGWRPAVGWICVLILAWQGLLAPIGEWVCVLCGVRNVTWPVLDGSYTTLVLLPMMGLTVARTVEKTQGVPDSTPLTKKVR